VLGEALHSTDPPDLVYSDEDEIDVCGVRANPVFKPDWSPDLLHSVHYIGQLAVWRTELVRRLGGLRPEHGGAAEYDLALRARETLQPNRIAHIPWVLYHRRRDPASAGGTSAARGRSDAELGALRAHLEHRGPPARVREHAPGVRRVSFALPRQPPRVSVVIPTRDRVDLLRRCVAGLLGETDYPELELLLVDNASRESTTLGYLHEIGQDPRVRVLAEPGRFNYSRMNNRAARIARGSLLAFLNNDVEIVERGWLRELVGHALRPEVGAVGALLSYASGEIQHAGIILGPGGVASLRHRGRRDPARVSYDRRPFATRNLSAVTAACMVLRRSVFDEVGGFDETDLAVAFNDVDLCLRIGRRGYRIVWTPHSRLLHHESQSEGPHDRPERSREFQREVLVMQARWERQLRADPFYNPNLSLELGREYELASPPRRIRPWD
jgi:GT2 family glycosyltransferase